jgi:hyperosmotically inducible periplasmic protein
MNSEFRYQHYIQYLFIIFLISGCASLFSSETIEAERQEDTELAMKIKSKFIESPELSGAAIHVDASLGIVQLSGFVETASQRELAESIARQLPEVKQVENQIEIK